MTDKDKYEAMKKEQMIQALFDDWENLTEDERIQLLHDAGYPNMKGDEEE